MGRAQRVEVFHKSLLLGAEIARYSIGMVARRMEDCGVRVHPSLILTGVRADGLDFVSSHGGHRHRHEGFDSVVLVYGAVPEHALYDRLRAAGSAREL